MYAPKTVLSLTLLATLLPTLATSSDAATLTLAWDPPTDGVTIGYTIHYGPDSGIYSAKVDIGLVSSFQVPGLADGTRYCFVMVARSAHGTTSGLSNEVCATTTAAAPPVTPPPTTPPPTVPETSSPAPNPPTTPAPSPLAEIFVAPDGRAGNAGTAAAPLDLATALGAASPAAPGSTIWLRGGRYMGSFTSMLRGTEAAPITVRQFPGERATLDGAGSSADVLTINGEWTTYWGFEVTSSHPGRVSTDPAATPSDLPRGGGIVVKGTNLKLVNLVVHDLLRGIQLTKESVGSQVYGTLAYYNGWQAPNGARGQAINAVNETGQRLIRENIIFNQFSHGIVAYGGSDVPLNDFVLEGNVVFGNGSLSTTGLERDILLGGGRVAERPIVRENFTYGGAQNNLGYSAGCANGVVSNNVLMGSSPLVLVRCTPQMTGNQFYSLYAERYGWGGLNTTFPQNTFHTRPPATNLIAVRPNAYEPGRGHVVIYNWQRQSVVDVSLATLGLQPGQGFEVRDAQNFFGPAVAQGTYSGAPISVPMSGLVAEPPVGNARLPLHTAPEFAVFVVVPSVTPQAPSSGPLSPALVLPAGGTYIGGVSVSMFTASGSAEIRYTLDGSAPTESSARYAGQLALATNTTVKARVFASGRSASPEVTHSYVIQQPTTAAPMVRPGGGVFTAPVQVTIASLTSGAAIHYTLDGSVPSRSSALYTAPLAISSSVTVRARAFGPDMLPSDVVQAAFTVNVPDRPPTVQWVAPANLAVLGGDVVLSVAAADDRSVARVEFTVNGRVVGTAATLPHQVSWSSRTVADGSYTLVATAIDSAGQRTATPGRSVRVANAVTAGAVATGQAVIVESEMGVLEGPMALANSPAASGGRYVGNSTSDRGAVTLNVTLTRAGDYRLWLRTMSMTADTVWVSVNGGPERVHTLARSRWLYAWQWAPFTGDATGASATPLVFQLAAGVHTVRIRTGRAINRLDTIALSDDPTWKP